MAYNPFLSMNEPSASVTTEALNPFMVTDSEPSEFNGDNPFAASNPFSDFGSTYEPPVGDTVPTDIFGGAEPTGAKHFEEFRREVPTPLDIFTSGSSETERMIKPTELDLVSSRTDHVFLEEEEPQGSQPTRPLPPETQNLILSVTGQMEFTSSHLLDRIPPTRTPSPVSVHDIHSPSPTPEPDAEPERQEEVVTESYDINRNKPVRPPPARPPPASRPPPPRPQPPPPRPPVAPSVTAVDHSNDINLFDAPVPATFKPTKEAIMSLYSVPKAVEKQIDFLSDDITDDMCIDTSQEISENFVGEVTTSSSMVINQTEAKSEQTTVSSTSPFNANQSSILTTAVAPMDCSEPQTNIPPTASNTSPFAEEAKDAYESQDTERNPFESAIEIESESNVFSNSAVDIFGVKANDVVMAPPNDIFNDAYVSPNHDVFNSDSEKAFGDIPMTKMDESQNNIFNKESTEVDAFNVGERDNFDNNALLTTADAGWGAPAEGLMQDAFTGGQDAFDAFSAKFDATSANNLNSGE